jgi:hypothetical protein
VVAGEVAALVAGLVAAVVGGGVAAAVAGEVAAVVAGLVAAVVATVVAGTVAGAVVLVGVLVIGAGVVVQAVRMAAQISIKGRTNRIWRCIGLLASA